MGLARDEVEASQTRGTPKIAVLSSDESKDGRIEVTSYSMGKVHSSLQLTGAVCLASAACIEGTVAWGIRQKGVMGRRRDSPVEMMKNVQTVGIRHAGGDMDVDVQVNSVDGTVEDVTVFRAVRRLFEGRVYYLM